ncbi:hypothetical protein [Streptomyces glaucescens]|uniref:hypothetical protein n=1 Tax=Streptomyces glaucescens TaxID=1907 RepID=UPI00131D3195|nr:hypothetical protein [Streptomyces glaucescens]
MAHLSPSDLSNMERAVALYASDMPVGFMMRRGTEATVAAWIIQGVVRLGLAEVQHSAACAYGYRLLWLADLTTPEQDRAHRRRFSNARRWDRAERLASCFTAWAGYPMTREALDRGGRTEVEGACRCGGTGWLGESYDPDDPTMLVERNCPGHNPEGLRLPRWEVGA